MQVIKNNLVFFLVIGTLAIVAGILFSLLKLSFLNPTNELYIFLAAAASISIIAGLALKFFGKGYKSNKGKSES